MPIKDYTRVRAKYTYALLRSFSLMRAIKVYNQCRISNSSNRLSHDQWVSIGKAYRPKANEKLASQQIRYIMSTELVREKADVMLYDILDSNGISQDYLTKCRKKIIDTSIDQPSAASKGVALQALEGFEKMRNMYPNQIKQSVNTNIHTTVNPDILKREIEEAVAVVMPADVPVSIESSKGIDIPILTDESALMSIDIPADEPEVLLRVRF